MAKKLSSFIKSKTEPFGFINEKGKFFIVAGNYKVSNKSFDTVKQAESYLGTKPYEIILNMACLIVQHEIKNYDTSKESAKVSEDNK